MMITPSIGSALWARRILSSPTPPITHRTEPTVPRTQPFEAFIRTLVRIQGYEEIGLLEDAVRELATLPSALRDLPVVERRRAKILEQLGQVTEALELYERTERCPLSQLGRVRCLARMHKIGDARRHMAAIPFDPALVKEFVETRDLLP